MGDGFGNEILGGAETLIRSGIRSGNYVPNGAGWRIAADGSAQFANVTIVAGGLVFTYPDGSKLFLSAQGTAIFFHGANGNVPFLVSNYGADTATQRLRINADGTILWGSGGLNDLSIGRFVAGRLGFGQDNAVDFIASVAGNVGNPFLRSTVNGEANARYYQEFSGKQHYGPGGAATQDTVGPYRSGVAELASDPIKANVGGSAEVWQGLGPVAGWFNSGQGVNGSYRLVASPPNSVEMVGDLTPGTKADGTQIATLAGNYRPTNLRTIPVSVDVTGAAGSQSPHFTIDPFGIVRCWGCAAAGRVMVQAWFSKDL